VSWFSKVKDALSRTRTQVSQVLGFSKLDDAWFDGLLDALVMADVHVQVATNVVERLKKDVKTNPKGYETSDAVRFALSQLLEEHLLVLEKPLPYPTTKTAEPYVLFVLGVNGAGKTTSLGKLAQHFSEQGLSVLLVAGDTFRAAAREQLAAWAKRSRVAFFERDGDPASVAFDGVMKAKQEGFDIVLLDSAGRLPTQVHLLDELKKIKRVLSKALPDAPHETLLVLDGSNGQNALSQARIFHQNLHVTGLMVTKLDGSAKGGVMVSIAHELKIPIRFLGVGEGVGDIIPFKAKGFAYALLGEPLLEQE
jgi:fused signal recognition particle receptor